MSKPKWTEEQQQVIDLRDRNILVSAAAGSGKTAVLVERIISEITTGDSPKDIDKLLVVTFTNAAAAEMRTRIGAAIDKKLQEEPENQHIQRQASLLHSAQICTIDSFCQFIIKNYFHIIDLDPAFRVGDETDLSLMKQEILQDLLEEKYAEAKEEKDSRFLKFTDMFSPGRTDQAIEDLILDLYNQATSYPWPEEWLQECATYYQIKDVTELEECKWIKALVAYLKKCVKEFLQIAQAAKKVCEDSDGPEAYNKAINSDINYLERFQNADTYQGFYQIFQEFNPLKLSPIRSKEVDPEKKDKVKALRESYQKNGLVALRDRFFYQSIEEMISDISAMAADVQELVNLTIEFQNAYAARKREEGILDFADMEHFALNILVQKDENGVRPSDIAIELQDYYEEILTDEYQDSNYVQELILNSICRAPQKAPFLFMVGDVKQSIYKFRLARPELFLEKYHNYTIGKGPFQRIDLHKNFRSRASVLESANHIFEQIMIESLGGIVYDQDARLVPGAEFGTCEQRNGEKTELILVEQKSEGETIDKKSLEAAEIGQKIRDMVQGEHPLYIKDNEEFRPVRYRDIAILLRGLVGWSEEFIEVLNDMGIPAYADTKTGYFTTIEVETVLNYLQIIDNPHQDIPLVSVLRSVFCNISDEELAWIGTMPDKMDYWDKVSQAATQAEEKLKQKLSQFMDRLEKYREFAKTRTVYELLRKVFEETGYYDIMSAMPSGEKRSANLDILLQQSIEFAENGHQGIYGFTRYIESLQKSNIDFGEASIHGENTDAVRIMTIHKSKGLEFPVVFVAGMGKKFNLRDARKGTIIDSDYGIGCDYTNLDLRIKQPTLMKRYLANYMTLNTLEEEIRILYVALTRAKEKLIITGTVGGLDKKIPTWLFKAKHTNFYYLSTAQTYLDWIVPAVMNRAKIASYFVQYLADGAEREEIHSDNADSLFEVSLLYPENIIQQEKKELEEELYSQQKLQNWDTETIYNQEMRDSLEKQESFKYPYEEEANLPVKVAVSELKHQAMEETVQKNMEKDAASKGKDSAEERSCEDDNEKMGIEETESQDEKLEIPRPAFMQETEVVSGAARGTLYHMVMQHFPYEEIAKSENDWGREEFDDYLNRLVKQGYMKKEEKELLNPTKFMTFLKRPIGQRMKQAALSGTLKREQPFMLGLKANEIYPEKKSEELIIVQGIIDAFFYEEENIILVDYKTDAIKKGQEQELINRYKAQLDYYAEALERLNGKKVSEKIIYSLTLSKEIEIK